jgi:hypothetical protein
MSLKQKTIFGYPPPTFLFMCLLALISLLILWIRFVYRPLPATSPVTPTIKAKLTKPILPPPGFPSLTIGSIQLVTTKPELPIAAPVFYASSSTSLLATAQILAGRLAMTKMGTTSATVNWQNPTSILTADSANKTLTYLFAYPANRPALSGPFPPEFPAATKSAEAFLQKYGLWQPTYRLDPTAVDYLKSENLGLLPLPTLPTASPTVKILPDVITLKYRYLLDGNPVISGNQSYPLQINTGHQGIIVGLVITPIPDQIRSRELYPILPYSQLTAAVKSELSRLIEVVPDVPGRSPLSSNLTSVQVASLELVGYYSPDQNTIYPAYLLKGHGQFADGTSAGLTFLTIAVDPGAFE